MDNLTSKSPFSTPVSPRASQRLPLVLSATLLALLSLSVVLALVARADSANDTAPPAPQAPDAVRNLYVYKSLYNSDDTGPGNLVVYRIQFKNTGNSTASDVIVTDSLPADLTYVSDWNDEGFTTILTGSAVVWTRPSVNANEYGYLYLAARVSVTASAGGVLTNVVHIASGDEEADPADNVYTHTNTIEAPTRDLKILKGVDSGDPVPGSEMTYKIYFYNEGATPLSNVVLTDILPLSVTYLSWDGELSNPYPLKVDLDETLTATVVGNQLVWHLSTLEGGSYGFVRPRVQVLGTVSPGEVLTNVARISTTDVETATVLNANVVTHTTTVLTAAVDLEIDKNLPWWETPVPGNEIEYEIEFENQGVLTATDVFITDTLPVSTSFVSWYGYIYSPDYTGLSQSVSPIINGGQIIWPLGSLVAGGNGRIYLTLQIADAATAGQVLSNVVEISTAETESSYANNVDDDVTAVEAPQLDLSVYKSSGEKGGPGGIVEYAITFSSYGSQLDASDVIITDTLPVSLTFLSWSGWMENPHPIDLDETLSASVTLTQVVWHLGEVVAGGKGAIYLRARITDTASVGAVLQNRVEITSSTPDVYLSNNADTQSTTVISPTEDVYVRKTLNGSPAAPGGTLQYYVYFRNEGGLPMDVSITDTLPLNTSFVSWNGTFYGSHSLDLDEEIGAAVQGNQVIWHVGQMLTDDYGNLHLTLRVDEAAHPGDVLTNTVEVSRGPTETDLADNDAVQITTVATPTRDLFVHKSRPLSGNAPGGTAYYSLYFQNEGNARANDVLLTDTLPAGANLIAWRGHLYDGQTLDLERLILAQVSGDQIVWPLGEVEAGGGGSIEVQLQLPATLNVGDPLTNVVRISTGDPETDYGNNVYTHTDELVSATRDLEISKGVSGEVGAPGGEMSYSFEFANYGNWPASNVLITDTLPDQVRFVSWEGGLYDEWGFLPLTTLSTPTVTGSQVIWDLGTLTPDVFGDLNLTVAITDAAQVGEPLENKVQISTTDPETNLANNTAIRTDQVLTYTRDLDVNKSRFGASGAPGGQMWFGIYFDNDGNWPAADVVISDTLPSNVSYVSWQGELYNPDPIDLDQVISATFAGDQIAWRLPQPLVGDGHGTIYLQVRVTDTARVGNLIRNEVEISTSDPETDYDHNQDIHADQVITRTWDLDPYKSLYDGTPAPGEQIEFQIAYENKGNWEASNVVITDTLPTGLTYVSSRDEGGPLTPTVVGGDTIVWSVGTLAAGESRHLYVTVQVDEGLSPGVKLYNRVEIASDHADERPRDNVDIVSVTLQQIDFPIYLPLVLKSQQ